MRRTFIVWARFHRRSELLAQHLKAKLHYVYAGPGARLPLLLGRHLGLLLGALARYLLQARVTWRILHQEQPDIIFVQNPPIFAVLLAFLYARSHGAHYVIDSHTGAFLSRKWRWSVGLHRLLSREALLTIVHNRSQEDTVKQWGCRHCVLGFTPGDYPLGERYSVDGRFSVAMVSGFEADEPHDVVLAAAQRLPEVHFYITGDPSRAPQVVSQMPENCHATGYLTYERYVGLLRVVDVVLDLTTVDHQLLMGGFEAVSLGKPLIVSDWPVLKDYFCLGTLHVPNTVDGVYEGVCRAQRELPDLQREILILRERLHAAYEDKIAELQLLLDGCQSNRSLHERRVDRDKT